MRRDAASICLLLLGVYLLTASGHLYSPDEEAMYYVTRGLARGAGVALPSGDVVPMPGRVGLGGQTYSPYGPLTSLLALPFYVLGAWGARAQADPAFDYLTRFSVSLLNAPLTALTGALVYVTVRRLGYTRGAGWLAALAYGLCTFAWPYARTFFSEPLAALLLLLAVERGLAWRAHARHWALAASGGAAGLLLATRIAEAVVLPLFAIYLLWPFVGEHRPLAGEHKVRPYYVLGVWVCGLLPGIALVAWYNVARFGTLLATGYGDESAAFTTPLLRGLFGLLLSPGKSLFLYAPPALLALPGAVVLGRRQRGAVLLLSSLVAVHVVLYARWHAWEGGGVWGPRLLLPVVPLLLVLAAPLFPQNRRTAEPQNGSQESGVRSQGFTHYVLRFTSHTPFVHRLWSFIIALLLAFGLVNALAGVLVNFSAYVNRDISFQQRVYSLANSPLVGHWRLLAERARAHLGPQRCALGDGFYAPVTPGALLPRFSAATAVISCRAAGPVLLRLSINDARPPGAPASSLTLQIAGQATPLRTGQSSQVHVLLPPGQALRLANTTWTPTQADQSQPPAPLGTLLYGLAASDHTGAPLPLANAAIEPPPASPRLRWGWYFVPYNHHLIDLWPWYLARSELAPDTQRLLAVALLGCGVLALGGAALLVRRA